jgi:hypothetical protein
MRIARNLKVRDEDRIHWKVYIPKGASVDRRLSHDFSIMRWAIAERTYMQVAGAEFIHAVEVSLNERLDKQ